MLRVVLGILILEAPTKATLTLNIAQRLSWDGVIAYLQVDRNRVQERLDAWYHSSQGGASDRKYNC